MLESKEHYYDIAVKIWGDLACFTRPEFKVERVTYSVMTPSAARGVLEAICWKPEIRWEIREIWVLKPIMEYAVIRNEIENRQSLGGRPIIIEDKRQQRASLFLKDPAYLIKADVRLKKTTPFPKKKYIEQFNRRIEKGQCHHQPYLGTRECSAWFAKITGSETPTESNINIGNMLFDIAFCQSSIRKEMTFVDHSEGKANEVRGFHQPLYFDAELKNGILKVPMEMYKELYRLEGINVKGIS